MKFYFIFCLISLILCASCPNQCSGHGSCGISGTCTCYDGYTFGDCSGKRCPYGQTYVEPGAKTTPVDDAHSYLECSGKGNCNRNNGLCECFDGFEGNACQRMSCPNSCSGHGLCVPVKHLKLEAGSDVYENSYAEAIVDGSDKYSAKRFDADQSYACVCDGEYSGYDCSEKKCPTGYTATSDCDSGSEESTITVEVPKTLVTGELVYLEYTDMYGRKWYSDKFDPTNAEEDISKHGWYFALKRLPVGVIDLKEVKGSKDKLDYADGGTVTIKFGNQQTGRQAGLKVITYKDIEADSNDLYPGANAPSGYHGMSLNDLKAGYGGNVDYTNAKVITTDFTITSSGISPSVCSGNGSCNTETGLCECFDGFYGNACTLTESSM